MYSEDELLPLSGLQHLLYCERQCALIHVEGQWGENRYTAEGRLAHERVHGGGGHSAPGLRTAFSLHLRSLALGLSGVADVVEFRQDTPGGPWRPFPVEHKRGRPKHGDADRVQLCAQAMCLEEMLGVEINAGALFYGQTRRRQDVAFDMSLRETTAGAARRFHELLDRGETPPARYDSALCDACSLLPLCQPRAAARRGGVESYLASVLGPEENA
ncbi:CRISPR-associated exonuclease, Cas4 family [Humidesulfovibrio mexicanus]|uniref:CRISPR-associated exonuclease Cas4 n=1 Tax=Humidesulfovibrio mexicanus TaxID=147047 RepID=A0A239AK16_9BACT|nr:CRISPR-associated protein Cas4 [Humidesulfovibrio mexicanus]SNR95889.1 CRISPR-associated exonuclease, Cas4 family [Humidesulfovibrio mexicanus]